MPKISSAWFDVILLLMITLLMGENSFEIERALAELTDSFDGRPEKFDGAELVLNQLPDLLMGVSLFADKRMIIIRGLSENKSIWNIFDNWIDKISDDIHLVLIESKPDKRTTAYKNISKKAETREFAAWIDRDLARAEKWVSDESEILGIKLDKKMISHLVARVGIDQWALYNALEKLSLIDNVNIDVIDEIIPASASENVFNLFETAIAGNRAELKKQIDNLEISEDPFKLAALLSSQGFQLAAVAFASPDDDPAKDFAIHPFVISKLRTTARKLSKHAVAEIIQILAELDDDMKISRAEPWILIEKAMYKIASI